MTNEPQTEEQKQVKRIIKRWQAFNFQKRTPFGLLCLAFFAYIAYRCWKLQTAIIPISYFAIYGGIIVFSWLLSWHLRKRFVSELTEEEQILLINTPENQLEPYERIYIKDFMKASRVMPSSKELLRASSPTHDDGTLLRAATQNHDIPQEELLRASHPSEP